MNIPYDDWNSQVGAFNIFWLIIPKYPFTGSNTIAGEGPIIAVPFIIPTIPSTSSGQDPQSYHLATLQEVDCALIGLARPNPTSYMEAKWYTVLIVVVAWFPNEIQYQENEKQPIPVFILEKPSNVGTCG